MTVPFCDARRPEVVVRVAIQLVRLEWRRQRADNPRPGFVIATVQALPFVRESLDFRLALSSMYLAVVSKRQTSKQWGQEAIRRSRAGELFRSVVFPAYKAQRRDPRVTNRGVSLRLPLTPADEDFELGIEGGGSDE
jgi:hypothetical protein